MSTRSLWEQEPNEINFTHAGFACKVSRSRHLGTLCGYVTVLPTHPCSGKGYDDVDTMLPDGVHGGLTYGDDDTYGFVCGHMGDYMPGSRYGFCDESDVYRDMGYVIREVVSLANQLAVIRDKKP